MSTHMMEKVQKNLRVQMSAGLHTAEQDFHFWNLRLIIWCTQHVFFFSNSKYQSTH